MAACFPHRRLFHTLCAACWPGPTSLFILGSLLGLGQCCRDERGLPAGGIVCYFRRGCPPAFMLSVMSVQGRALSTERILPGKASWKQSSYGARAEGQGGPGWLTPGMCLFLAIGSPVLSPSSATAASQELPKGDDSIGAGAVALLSELLLFCLQSGAFLGAAASWN